MSSLTNGRCVKCCLPFHLWRDSRKKKRQEREREMFSLLFLFLSTYFQIGSDIPSIVSYFEYKYSSISSFESSSNCGSSSFFRWLPVQVRTFSLPSDRRLYDLWHYNSRLQTHVCRALPCHASRDDQSTILNLWFVALDFHCMGVRKKCTVHCRSMAHNLKTVEWS